MENLSWPELPEELQEAGELRRAIMQGEVDAFVIDHGQSDKRVLLLANAYQRYRQIVERMPQGVVTVSAGGTVLFANQKFLSLLDTSLNSIFSTPFENHFAVTERPRLHALLSYGAARSQGEFNLVRRDGLTVPVQISLASFIDGYATLLVSDLAELQWTSTAAAALEAMRGALEQLNRASTPEPATRKALDVIGREVNALSRLLDELEERLKK